MLGRVNFDSGKKKTKKIRQKCNAWAHTGGRDGDVELKLSVVLREASEAASPGLAAAWAAVAKRLSVAVPSKRGRGQPSSSNGDADGACGHKAAGVLVECVFA